MSISGISGSGGIGNFQAMRPQNDPVKQLLQQSLASGKITQTQYNDTLKKLETLKQQFDSQFSKGTKPTQDQVKQLRQQASDILKQVGLQLPAGKAQHGHHSHKPDSTSDAGAGGSVTSTGSASTGSASQGIQDALDLASSR